MPSNHLSAIFKEHAAWGLAGVSEPRLVSELVGGLTNQSFLIELAGSLYVLRLFAENTLQLNINRRAEFTIATLAAEHSLAALPVYIDPNERYSLSEYIEGDLLGLSTWDQTSRLQQLALSLKNLHAINITIKLPQLNITDKAESYWQAIEERSSRASLLVYKPQLQTLFSQQPGQAEEVLCHNDLVLENMIVTGQGLRLIDWEYAAVGNPYFDLATVILNQQLSPHDEQCFLAAYSDQLDTETITQAKQQVRYLEWLWWAIQGEAEGELLKRLKLFYSP